MTRTLRSSALLFPLAALTLIAACVAIVRSHRFALHPDVLAWAVTFDLTVTVPLLYWLLVVRSGRAPLLSAAPVFLVSLAVAAAVVPRGQQTFLRDLHLLAVPVELAVAGAVIRRIARVTKQERNGTDPYVRIGEACRDLVGPNRAADVLASELAVVYYSLFCWRKKRPAGGFTLYERSGWSSILVCLFVLMAAESVGMHLLLRLWTPVAAWIWTALDAYAVLWLLADYHALRLRASTVEGDALHVRYGFRWNVTVPLANVAAVVERPDESTWQGRRDVLKLAMFDSPDWLLELREPVVAQGPAGIRKRVTAIALLPDGEQELRHIAEQRSAWPAAHPPR